MLKRHVGMRRYYETAELMAEEMRLKDLYERMAGDEHRVALEAHREKYAKYAPARTIRESYLTG